MDLADRDAGEVVHAEDGIAGEALEEALFDHAPRATAAAELLGGLEDQHDSAVAPKLPTLHMLGEELGGTEQHRGMAVVAAAMHLAGHGARPRQPGHLLHRDGVHVGAQADRAPAAVTHAQHAHHAGDGDAGMHLVAPGAQALGDQGAGGMLLEAELGVAVDGMAPGPHALHVRLEPCCIDRHLALLP